MYCIYLGFTRRLHFLAFIVMVVNSFLWSNQPLTASPNQYYPESAGLIIESNLEELNPDSTWQIIDSLLQIENTKTSGFPPIWDFPTQTDKIHGYIINLAANPRINEIPLQAGDYIGGFFLRNGQRVCGGARVWNGTENMTVILFGDDGTTPIKDGFSGGEMIQFRFFLWETQKEYIVSIMSYHVQVGYVTNGRWYPTSISMVMNMKAVSNMDFYINTSENPTCINNQIILSATEFIGSGGPYSFQWSSDPPGFNHIVQNPPPVILDVTTDFFLTVTDPNHTSTHNITVIVNEDPTAHAGNDCQVCANGTFAVSGVATNSLNVAWNTSGDGVFDTPFQSSAVYSPGPQDIINGSATLIFSAEPLSPCSILAEDELQLTILPIPSVFAGEDRSACGNEEITLVAEAANYNSVIWTTSGSGTFSNPASTTTQYTPSSNDVTNGVTLTICAQAISPCVAAISDQLQIQFLAGPTASAPSIIRRCEGITFSISGSVSNNSGVLWTTQGDGTFANPSVIPAIYTPGPQDIANFGTIVTLNSLPIASCDTAKKNVTLFIQQLPKIVTFGPETNSICITDSFLQLNAQVEEYTVLSWSRSGDGYFSSTNVLNPKYYPGPNDFANGSFGLTLYASPKQHCSVGTSVTKSIIIQDLPSVYAGEDSSMLSGNGFITDGAVAENYAEVEWVTTGDGYFDLPNELISTYSNGPGDEIAGTVDLILIAHSIYPCTISVSDTLTLEVISAGGHNAIANAGVDQIICSSDSVSLASATAAFYASLEWTTTGDGYFSNYQQLKPNYYPGTDDLLTGNVTLCLTAFAVADTLENATDCMNVSITAAPSVQIGDDSTICEGMPFGLNGSVANQSGFVWQTSGDGYFSNPQSLNPAYHHGANDLQNGQVQICLYAIANEGCDDISDCLTLFIQKLPVVNAGNDFTVCANTLIQLTAEAYHFNLLQWESQGDGQFSNTNVLQPIYMPGPGDLSAGFVTLCLTATGQNGCGYATDCITVSLQPIPSVNVTEDINICEDEVANLSASAENFGFTLWSTSGDGSFCSPTSLSPAYTPGESDIANGQVQLCLTASGISGCANAEDCLTLFIHQSPTVDAGSDISVCGTMSFMISAMAENYTGLNWATNGDGVFSNPHTLNPEYTPGADDLQAGSVVLCLTATGSDFCDSATDCVTIFINDYPTVEAGQNLTVCANETVQLTGAAQNFEGLVWTTDGDGNFSNTGSMNPSYTPGTSDLENGSVQLCLKAFGEGVCSDVSDCLTITFQPKPIAFAGTDATVIIDENYTITNASATSASSLLWTTSGTGSFSDASIIHPVYHPGPADYSSGSVILTLKAYPLEPCVDAMSDQIQLTFIPGCEDAIADAGDDLTTCTSEPVALSGSAQNQVAVLWQTAGDGTFENAVSLETLYYPGTADLAAGNVNVNLTAFALDGCMDDTDQIMLTLEDPPLVDAGEDHVICETELYVILQGSASGHNAVQWTSSGDGSFETENEISAYYNPGPSDHQNGGAILTLTAYSDFCEPVSDQLTLTIVQAPIVFAGEASSVCAGEPFTALEAFAVNFETLLWTSSGDGYFDEPGELISTYYPGQQDILNGSVELCLKAFAIEPCAGDQHCFTLTILPNAWVDAGEDKAICQTQPASLNASAQHFSSVLWQTNGDGAFTNASSLVTEYEPGVADIANGIVLLTINAFSNNGCNGATSQVTVSIEKSPMANAGGDLTICQTDAAQMNATATDYSSLVWTTNGDGTFSNASALNTVYYPGDNDIAIGQVILELTAFAIELCDKAVDAISLDLQPVPVVLAGNDITLCKSSPSVSLEGTASNYSSISWSSNGDGWFENSSSLLTKYHPGTGDLNAGDVTICLQANGINGCQPVQDCFEVTFQNAPTANAGQDATVCHGQNAVLNGVSANFNTTFWQSDGDGYFDNPTLLITTYTPGPQDIALGTVNLCLTAEGITPCQNATDCVIITIQPLPFVSVGNDLEVCVSDQIMLDAAAFNYSSLSWSSAGDGSFSNANALNTQYIPGNQDLSNGFVNICLTANGIEPCNEASDCLQVTFVPFPQAYAGADATVFNPDVYFTAEATVENISALLWSTSGTGYFADPNALHTHYNLSFEDILNSPVMLTLTAFPINPCQVAAVDELSLNIDPCCLDAIADAGVDDVVCLGNSYQLINASALFHESLIWETSGDGSFDDNAILHATYTPGANDILAGSITLCLTAFGVDGSENDTDCMEITMVYPPVAFAGIDKTVLFPEQGGHELIDAFAEHYDAIQWFTTNGLGYFSDETVVNPAYNPSPLDLSFDYVELQMNCSPINPCLVTAESVVHIKFYECCLDAIADAGEDITACANEAISISGSAQNQVAVLWQTAGDGTFENAVSLETLYYPGIADLAAGGVNLSFTALAFAGGADDTDQVTITLLEAPLVNAGVEQVMCEKEFYVILQASASGHNAVQWTTSGDGFFILEEVISPYYFPGSLDRQNGFAMLTLTALSDFCEPVSDQVTITIVQSPEVIAGESSSVCAGDSFTTLGASAANFDELFWTSSGDGYFDEPGELISTYFPGQQDILNGSIELCLKAFAFEPCAGDQHCFTLTILPNAWVDAGEDKAICQTQPASLNASAQHFSSVLWQSSGDGAFTNSSNLVTEYIPGNLDIANGLVILSINAFSNNGCNGATSQVTVSIEKSPMTYAGVDLTICQTDAALLNATASDYSSLIWTTNGDGSFSNASVLNPKYFPGEEDIAAGQVTLELIAFAIDLCAKATDQVLINLQPVPVAWAGNDITLCKSPTPISLQGVASNYSSISWSSNGDGWFENATSLVTKYHPGTGDLNAGNVSICLQANGINGCQPVQDCFEVTFRNVPTVNAGQDATVCLGQSALLNGVSANFNTTLWQSDGDGYFDNPTLLITTYTPGPQDIAQGTVNLCLTAEGITPCLDATDCVIITIQPLPFVSVINDLEVCVTDQIMLDATAFNYSNLSWSSAGDGSFSNANALNTQYIPGDQDLANGFVNICLTANGIEPCNEASDCLQVTFVPFPQAYAGADATVLNPDVYFTAEATVENISALLWSTSGTGNFADPTALHTQYIHSFEDMLNSPVMLTLTAFPINPCQVAAIDELSLTILYDCLDPIADAGGDVAVCEDTSIQLLNATVLYTDNFYWSTTGDGTFDDISVIDPVYTPGENDLIAGTATLCLTANANGDCLDAQDCITLFIQPLPAVFAGNDNTVLLESYTFEDAWEINSSVIQWFTTNGMGGFVNENIINATYEPSYFDHMFDFVEFKVTAFSINPCNVAVEDVIHIKFYDGCLDAIADAGDDLTTCTSEPVALSGSAQNQVAVLWQTAGDGTFENAVSLETLYYPGTADLAAGNVNVNLTAFALDGCMDDTDQIMLTLEDPPLVDAGEDHVICETELYVILQGSASGHNAVQWTSSGDGSFETENEISAYYNPGPSDHQNGGAILTLTAYSDFCEPVSDQLTLTIVQAPIVFAGEASSVCAGEPFTALEAFAVNFETLLWTSSGDGYFDEPGELISTYYPGQQDILNGSVELCLKAFAIEPCAGDQHCFTLTILPNAWVDAGEDKAICQTQPASLNASAQHFSSVLWQTNGDGAFTNASSLVTEYEPGVADIANGIVLLTINAFSNNGCNGATSQVTVSIEKSPMANAGVDLTICQTDAAQMNATATDYSSLVWTTNGDGSFSNASVLNPKYFPGEEDIAAGQVTLELTAFAIDLCNKATDEITLFTYNLPAVSAGQDQTICETATFMLDGQAVNYSSFEWSSGGDGLFDNSGILNPVYDPGPGDISLGFVELCLTAEPVEPCTLASSDCMMLYLAPLPDVTINENLTICENQNITLTATALNCCNYYWQTSGDGFFDEISSLNPIYTPGAGDILSGEVELCFIAQGCEPCTETLEICMSLTIQPLPVVFAGSDGTVCGDYPYLLDQATALHFSTLSWSTNGDGIFGNNADLNTFYIPGANDIGTGFAEICLTALPANPCSISSEDCLTIDILPKPFADAGQDLSVCSTNSFINLAGNVEHQDSFHWSSTGTGNFDNPNKLDPRYFFSFWDRQQGHVRIILHAVSTNCGAVTDTIDVEIFPQAIVNAGPDQSICSSEAFLTSFAIATNVTDVLWTSGGDGYFDTPSALNTIYHPGINDIQTGFVMLCLNGNAFSPCVDKSDCMTLTLLPSAFVNAGGDIEICETDPVPVIATALNYQSVLWQTSGDGIFGNPTSLETWYYPGALDIDAGSVSIAVTAISNTNCSNASDDLLIQFQPVTSAFAGNDQVICENEQVSLAGTAEHAVSVMWSSYGDGIFIDPNSSETTYFPGESDIANGEVSLCFTAYSSGLCADPVDCLTIVINPMPTVFAGESDVICQTDSYTLNPTIHNYSGILWNSNGDGTFDNPALPNSIYTPGYGDLASGEVMLTIVAYGLESCNLTESSLTLFLNPPPQAFAGEDITICENDMALLDGIAQNYESPIWQTSGDGYFDNISSLSTSYIPGAGDIAAGFAEICLFVNGSEGCEPTSDCLLLSISQLPVVYSGNDQLVCITENIDLYASADYAESVIWSTAGDGYFTVVDYLQTTYIPGQQDLAAGTVDLCLTASGTDPCEDVSDCLTITFIPLPAVFAGDDVTIGKNDTFSTSSAMVENNNGLLWTTTGTGQFDDPTLLVSTYTPGFDDILYGTVILTLTAYPISPCQVSASDDMVISIYYDCLDAVANAGADDVVCLGNSYQLINASALFHESLIWETSGDGSFDDNTILHATYTPGANDILTGNITLCLTAFGFDGCENGTDCMEITMVYPPVAFAGNDNTVPFPEEGGYELFDASAEHYGAIQWFTTNGMGYFSDETVVNPVYNPSPMELHFDYVELQMNCSPINPCLVTAESVVHIKFYECCLDAIADAGEDDVVCLGNSYQLINASASFHESLIWETSGDGSFDDNTILHATYTPGANDILAGSITLCLTAFGVDGNENDTDCMELTVVYPPTAFAGNDNTVLFPEEGGYELFDAFAEHYDAIQWITTNGMGYFSDETVVNPVYYPSPMEIDFDYVALQMNCSSINPCLVTAESVVHITFTEDCTDATASISGEVMFYCSSNPLIHLEATATTFDSFVWTTTGDGEFDPANSLTPQYFPGPDDLTNGEFILILTANAYGECQSAADSLPVFSQKIPIVYAGADKTICGGEVLTIDDAFAENYSAVSWSSNGDGYFSQPDDFYTEYFPGANDLTYGGAVLSLTAEGISPCEIFETASFLLTIDRPFILVDLSNDEVRLGDDITFTIQANNANAYQWYGPYGLMEGEIQSSLTIYDAAYDDTGSYYCEISNLCLTVTSNIVQLSVFEIHELTIPAGWSGISSWIVPFDPEIEHIFGDVTDDLLLIKNMTEIYCPMLELNILSTWDPQKGYETKFLNNAIVDFKGIENNNRTTVLMAGWNYLPVISRCEVNIVDVFGTLPVNIIKEIGGTGVYWPAMGINTIGHLLPGKAYKIHAISTFSVTYPESESTKSGITGDVLRPLNQTPWNEIHYTASTHLIAFDKEAINHLTAGGFVGAFNEHGLCVGFMEVSGNTTAMTVFGSDNLTLATDGMLEDDLIIYRYYDPATGNSFDLEVEYDTHFSDHQGVFRYNGLSRVIGLKTNVIAVGEIDAQPLLIYPNPTSGLLNVSGVDINSSVEIYSAGGQLMQKVRTELNTGGQNALELSLENYPAGVYYLKIVSEKRTDVRKVIRR